MKLDNPEQTPDRMVHHLMSRHTGLHCHRLTTRSVQIVIKDGITT
jgi:hypothetical protein